jgi:RNA-directed DNA polymerase
MATCEVSLHQLRQRMHEPTEQTGEWLQSVVHGYFNYHPVPGNTDSLGIFRQRVTRLWRWALRRRGQKHRPNWARKPLGWTCSVGTR